MMKRQHQRMNSKPEWHRHYHCELTRVFANRTGIFRKDTKSILTVLIRPFLAEKWISSDWVQTQILAIMSQWEYGVTRFTSHRPDQTSTLSIIVTRFINYCHQEHAYRRHVYFALKQASHWHHKGFTPWHAIWRANEGRTRDSVRGDAWWCGSGERSACHVVAKILKCSKIYFQGVTTCHDEIVK